MTISLLHPCRSRVERSWNCMSEWILRAGKGIDLEVIISIDESDPRRDDFLKVYEGFQVIVNPNDCAVQAVNRAADVSTGEVLIVVSDDFTCPPDWGERIQRAIKGKRDFVLKTADGIQPYIVTLPILDRKYYERFGYIYPEVYRHMFRGHRIYPCRGPFRPHHHPSGHPLPAQPLFKHTRKKTPPERRGNFKGRRYFRRGKKDIFGQGEKQFWTDAKRTGHSKRGT